MATAPVKSQPLHNFDLPPFFEWATSANHPRFGNPPSSSSKKPHGQPPPPPPPLASENGNSESELEKNYSDSVTRDNRAGSKSTRTRALNLAEKLHNNTPERENSNAEIDEGVKPWNLRPRKATLSKFTTNGELHNMTGCGVVGMKRERANEEREKPRKEKRKLWIALSKDEIEEDVFSMTGSRPSRRPRRRPKNVQKHLDCVFPGLWLVGMTADGFRLADPPAKR